MAKNSDQWMGERYNEQVTCISGQQDDVKMENDLDQAIIDPFVSFPEVKGIEFEENLYHLLCCSDRNYNSGQW